MNLWLTMGLTSLLLGGWSLFQSGKAQASEAPKPTPKPTPNPAPKPTANAPMQPAKSTPNVFISRVEDCVIRDSGSQDAGGRHWMREPLWDAANDCYARLRYSDAPAALAKFGFKLATQADWEALKNASGVTILEPCTLVSQQSDFAKMRSLDFARKHDACVKAQLDKLGWLGNTVLLNCGKQWLPGAPPGKSINFGWMRTKPGVNGKGEPRPAGSWIQTPGTAHEAAYTDYSQLTQGIRQ